MLVSTQKMQAAKIAAEKDSEENVLDTDLDSLFIEELPPITYDLHVTQEDQDNIPDCPSIVQIQTGGSIAKYTYYQEEFAAEGSELHKIMQKLRTAEIGSQLEYHITSPGGSVMQGMNMVQIMKERFKGKTTTYLEHFVASMGSMLFVCGDKRVAREDSHFMLHDFQYGMGGSGGTMVKRAQFNNEWLDPFFRRLLVKPGFITEEEFLQLKRNDEAYYGTEELVIRGIATHVSVDGIELEGENYLEYLESGVSVEEYLEYKALEEDEEEGLTISIDGSEVDLAGLLGLLGNFDDDDEEGEEDERLQD